MITKSNFNKIANNSKIIIKAFLIVIIILTILSLFVRWPTPLSKSYRLFSDISHITYVLKNAPPEKRTAVLKKLHIPWFTAKINYYTSNENSVKYFQIRDSVMNFVDSPKYGSFFLQVIDEELVVKFINNTPSEKEIFCMDTGNETDTKKYYEAIAKTSYELVFFDSVVRQPIKRKSEETEDVFCEKVGSNEQVYLLYKFKL